MIKILKRHFILSLFTARHFSKNKSIFLFIKIFNIRFFFGFDFIRKFFSNKKFIEGTFSTTYFEKDISSELVFKDLIERGFNFKLKLKEPFIKSISNEISNENVFVNFKGDYNYIDFLNNSKKFENLNQIYLKSIDYKIPHVAIDIDLAKTKVLKKFVTSNFFLNIAKNYIGEKKISISSQCYISNPFKTTENKKKDLAQYFHYDNDFKKFFKTFIYLTDVDENSGPHIFIEKTNTKKFFKHITAERIDDIEILNSYPNNTMKEFRGPQGSMIIEDTFGLHKGQSPKSKSRIMLIVIFGEDIGMDTYKNPLLIDLKKL